MSQSMIQIPVSPTVKRNAEAKAQKMGFDSVEDMLASFVVKISAKDFTTDKTVQLSKKAIDRYNKMDEDHKNGKNWYKFEDVDDALSFLIQDKR